MADRFWVGGAGTWNTSSTTNWSATSGGGSGASVPTVADSVFFDQAGTYTVTMTGALNCLDITVSAGTVTFATGTSPTLNVRGSMSLVAGTVWSSTGVITFSSTTTGRTVTTNGTVISASMFFDGVGGAWTLGSALNFTSTRTIILTRGTFNTADYSVSVPSFSSNNSNTRAINFGASTITLSEASAIDFAVATGLTFNAGTSSIVCTNNNVRFDCGTSAQTFNNVSFTSISGSSHQIIGLITFNNLSVTARSSAGVTQVTFNARQTINGTLSTTGTAGNRRVFFASATYGISVDLVVNSAPSLTDADFRGLYVRGTSAPISGTRIGNRGECRGITFSTPKTVYWNLSGFRSWSDDAWAATPAGTPSTNNFPLPQDIATFTNSGSVGTASLNGAIDYVGTIDMSGRTTAMTLGFDANTTVYGDWKNGSGTTFASTLRTLTFSGGGTQTITSAGKSFIGPITIDTYGGTVQLADALSNGSYALTVTNGTYDTAGYASTFSTIDTSGNNPKTILLRSSTVSVGRCSLVATNLTFNAGTSQVNIAFNGDVSFSTSGQVFYNVTFTGTFAATYSFNAANTFNNLTITAPSSAGYIVCAFSANQTISGTLTCAGASAVRRIFLRSNTIGTPRTLTVNSISATDCDFRDINLAGAASGASPTRAGDCGGNTGITFPAPKTVYWNLAGTNSWLATGWAASSGGTPDINQFPLAQDTAVFDNAGAITEIRLQNNVIISGINAANRTTAMALNSFGSNSGIYGSIVLGSGVTVTSTSNPIAFFKSGTQTITSNGIQFGCPIAVSHPLANVQLADALSLNSAATLTLNAGTFDAVTYNVTAGAFTNNATSTTLRMGSGTWTLSGTGFVWNATNNPTLIVGTSNIVLSDTSTSARTFSGGSLYYNKLTIGGATGTSTLTIAGGNTFGELASTKTVAHTIAFASTVQTFGKWAVTGTAGNVVTITGTSTTNVIAGPAVTGVDYLVMGTWGVSTTSPGEFYAGANSTGTAAAPVFRTAAPAPRTLYWVGGTGNWSSTTKWSTSSGGGSGAAIPTSLDAVIFDAMSNATAYTATIDAGVSPLARCASFTMAGPLTGNVTFAGSVSIAFHGNVSFAATGITRTYVGAMLWAGNSSYTFTTNGLILESSCTVTGIGASWALGSAFSIINFTNFTVTFGSFTTSLSSYSLDCAAFTSSNSNVRSISLNSSTVNLTSNSFAISFFAVNFNFNSGFSQINCSGVNHTFAGGGQTFYNVSYTSTLRNDNQIQGQNVFNNLSIAGKTNTGISALTFTGSQTINGTLTLGAGSASANRTFLASETIGTTRTLTVNAFAAGAADYDFRDIAITGAAAPISGTRFGNARGNSGITFSAAKTVYWAISGTSNWGAGGSGSWALTNGGSVDVTAFPLAQDTAFIPFATPVNNQTITVNAKYNIGTLDMNERNGSALLTLATGTTSPTIYGNWINGTGTTLSGTQFFTFAGRGSQTITSAGRTFTQAFSIDTLGGSVTLQDAFVTSSNSSLAIGLFNGTFDANGYNVSITAGQIQLVATTPRTVAIGAGTWLIAGGFTAWNANTATNLTVTGTGTISFTSASATSFLGGNANYSGITLNQGGAGTLTISGNNTFKTITNTYSATGATSIALGATTQTLTNPWTATGAAGRVLTVSGSSAASPATLIFSGSGTAANVDYLAINNVRAYDLVDEWYAGTNSTNNGSLGWYFVAGPGNVYAVFITESASGVDAILASTPANVYDSSVSESGSGIDAVSAFNTFSGAVIESASGVDAVSALAALSSAVAESASGVDVASALASLGSAVAEAASGVDSQASTLTLLSSIAEAASAIDAVAGGAVFTPIILESASGIDEVLSSAQFGSAVNETASGVDTVSSLASLGSAISESASGVDSVSALASLGSAVAETAGGVDDILAFAAFEGVVLESSSGVDAVASSAVSASVISETASGVDATSSSAVFTPVVSETASGLDAVSSLATLGSAVSETASGVDTVASSPVYTQSIVETASGVDAVESAAVFVPVISESASGLDSISGFSGVGRSVSETATAVTSIDSIAVLGGTITETASGVDTTSALASLGSAVSETASGVDTVAGLRTLPGDISETASGVDSSSAFPVLASSASETASGIDAVSTLTVLVSVASETAGGLDSNASTVVFTSSASETASGIDTVSSLATFGGIVLETASGIDATVGFISFPSLLSETASGVDAVSGAQTMVANAAEAASGADSASTLVSVGSVVSETSSGADVVAALASLGSAISEASSGVDAVAPAVIRSGSVDETASGIDSLDVSNTLNALVLEASSTQDIVLGFMLAAAQISESASGADQVSALRDLAAAVVEAVSGLDEVSASAVFQSILQEIATLTDFVNAPGSTYSALIAELAALQDVVQAAAIFPSAVIEATTVAETNSAALIALAAVEESATATDVTSALAVFAAQTAESANIADEVSPPGSIYNAIVLAVAQMLDQVNPPGSIYNAQVLESATLADSLIGAFLWIDVNDDQVANWGDINNVQTTTWLAVDDSQTTNWQNVNNTQTSGWTDVNDTQTPGWNPVLP